MSRCVASAEPVRSLVVFRLAVCASLAMAAAGCSADTNRFDQPFSNPFASQPQPDQRGDRLGRSSSRISVAEPAAAAGAACRQPQYSQPPAPPLASRPPRQDVEPGRSSRPWRALRSSNGTANGGTADHGAQGETIESIVAPLRRAGRSRSPKPTTCRTAAALIPASAWSSRYDYGQTAAVRLRAPHRAGAAARVGADRPARRATHRRASMFTWSRRARR